MLTKKENIQTQMILYTLEDLVPEDSLYRKIDKYIDFNFIYDEVKDLYCVNNGRPCIDPVVLFKLVFIQALDGLKSMRKTCEKIKVDAEYRWFLKIPFGESTPHYSTFSQNYIRRFKDSDVFEKIFVNIVEQAIKYKLVKGDTFFTDSTHKKANANKNKFHEEIQYTVKKRREWLEEEINEERRKQGKKEFKYKDEEEEKKVKISDTDEESGYYHRDNKEKGFMYLDHRTVDSKCNIIVDCYITKGNVHDATPFIERAEYIKNKFGFQAKRWALDSGYDTLDIKKYLHDNKIFGVIGYRRYQKGETQISKRRFEYKKEIDSYICPETGIILAYKGRIDRQGYKIYSEKENCKNCPEIKRCCKKQGYRIIRRHIKEELNEEFRNNRISKEGKELYKLRKEKIERSFADSKQNHGYRYAMYKGVKKNQNYTWLICAAQNMKNIVTKITKGSKDNNGNKEDLSNLIIKIKILLISQKIFKKITNLRFFSKVCQYSEIHSVSLSCLLEFQIKSIYNEKNVRNVIVMVYEFAKYPDETLVAFSDIRKKDNGEEYIKVSFERPTENGFDTVVFELPSYEIVEQDGNYSEEEIKEFRETVEKGAHLFFKYARQGRIQNLEFPIRNKYKIITLCGSIKFKDEFMKVQEKLTLDGNIVLTPNFFNNIKKENIDEKTKKMLDEMHKQKIDMSDEIYVINVGGYMGESTKLEIEYAKRKGKKISYLERIK